MTIKPIKPARVVLEKETKEERIRYLRREQAEQEARASLRDFLRHQKEDEDDLDAPTNPL